MNKLFVLFCLFLFVTSIPSSGSIGRSRSACYGSECPVCEYRCPDRRIEEFDQLDLLARSNRIRLTTIQTLCGGICSCENLSERAYNRGLITLREKLRFLQFLKRRLCDGSRTLENSGEDSSLESY